MEDCQAMDAFQKKWPTNIYIHQIKLDNNDESTASVTSGSSDVWILLRNNNGKDFRLPLEATAETLSHPPTARGRKFYVIHINKRRAWETERTCQDDINNTSVVLSTRDTNLLSPYWTWVKQTYTTEDSLFLTRDKRKDCVFLIGTLYEPNMRLTAERSPFWGRPPCRSMIFHISLFWTHWPT